MMTIFISGWTKSSHSSHLLIYHRHSHTLLQSLRTIHSWKWKLQQRFYQEDSNAMSFSLTLLSHLLFRWCSQSSPLLSTTTTRLAPSLVGGWLHHAFIFRQDLTASLPKGLNHGQGLRQNILWKDCSWTYILLIIYLYNKICKAFICLPSPSGSTDLLFPEAKYYL